MHTQVASPDDLEEAIDFLKRGIPIAFPTETVYGLGAPVHLPEAIEKIFSIKGRSSDNPLIAHVASIDEAVLLSDDLPEAFFLLADRFWPGPLTLVVKKSITAPMILTGGLKSIALRMPSHGVARRLIEGAGPLAAPSANLSGRPSPTSALDVLEDLGGKIPLVVDGGDCPLGIESTVLSLLDKKPVLLRPGMLKKEELEEVLRQKIKDPLPNGPVLSPGMKYRHYAPKAKVSLIFKPEDLKGPCILSPMPTSGMRLLNEKTLYSELRRADRYGIEEIKIDCTGSLKNNAALMNRLIRASQI